MMYEVKPNGGWKGEAQDYCAWAVASKKDFGRSYPARGLLVYPSNR
jgi:hypothetical protein